MYMAIFHSRSLYLQFYCLFTIPTIPELFISQQAMQVIRLFLRVDFKYLKQEKTITAGKKFGQ